MTKAVCFRCGHLKFGSFLPCDQCQAKPQTDEELIASLAMTEHYFDQATLESMREYIREHGRHPELDPNSMKIFRKALEEAKASGALKELYQPRENDEGK